MIKQRLQKWLEIPKKPKFEELKQEELQRIMHGAYAGIVCAVCGNNVFRGEGEWIHGNGGRAYCLKTCWNRRNEGEE